jgi:hypothetical protein
MGGGEAVRRRKILCAIIFAALITIAAATYFYREIDIYAFKFKGYESYETEHFIILFKPESRSDVPVVANAAEKARYIVGRDFNYFPGEKIPVVIYPDSASLQAAFNWPADESAQGVYYRGFIYVQAPGALIGGAGGVEKTFFERGPMVHEYTHLVVDRLTSGNYPRWFTEGVAQYEEERVTGYSLEKDFYVDWSSRYSTKDIFTRFDELPDVPKAYLQSLDMIKSLAGERGINEIKNVMALLRSGASADEIFLQRVRGSL